MSEHRYPSSALRGDYLRAAAGLLICGGVLFGVGATGVVFYLFVALTGLFVYFAWRTWQRRNMVVTVDDDGIAASSNRLAWQDLNKVKLSYYATRRGRGDGWMQLAMRGRSGTVNLDSHIDDFPSIARRAWDAATHNGVEMSSVTTANFAAMGVGTSSRTRWGDPASWQSEVPAAHGESPTGGVRPSP